MSSTTQTRFNAFMAAVDVADTTQAFTDLCLHDLPLRHEPREELRLRETLPLLVAGPRQRAIDLTVGVEDRAVRIPEGTRLDLRRGQDEVSVGAAAASSSGLRILRKMSRRRQ